MPENIVPYFYELESGDNDSEKRQDMRERGAFDNHPDQRPHVTE
jgi:hypothetical protein